MHLVKNAKMAAPLLPTLFLIGWTAAVYPHSTYGDNWAIYPALLVWPAVLVWHVILVITSRPRTFWVLYGVAHVMLLSVIWVGCLMLISKDSL